MVTGWAGVGNWGFIAASVADEFVVIGVEGERKEASWTEGLPAATFANCQRCGAATIVENEGLVVVVEIGFYRREEYVGEIAVFLKGGAVF